MDDSPIPPDDDQTWVAARLGSGEAGRRPERPHSAASVAAFDTQNVLDVDIHESEIRGLQRQFSDVSSEEPIRPAPAALSRRSWDQCAARDWRW